MDQMEDRLPVLLRRLAGEVPPPVAVPPELMRRSRRRILLNGVLTAAVVAGLAVGSVTVFRTLIAGDVRDRQVPASDPTPVVGKIAFPSSDGGIYLVNSSGGGPVRLTQGEFPSFSPDGTRIAFTRSGQVYVTEADGTGISRLTDQARAPGRLAWSPDGTRIAFVGTRDGEHGLIIVNSDGGGTPRFVEEIPAGGDRSTPSWSPDGGQILIGTDGEGFLLVDVQTGATSLLPGDPRMAEDQRDCGTLFGPAYSPNGSTIAFALWRTQGLLGCRPDGLFLMDADGTNVRRLTDRSLSPWGPSWSPDGTRIAFFSQPGGPTSALYVVNVDGSGLTKLADIGQGDLAGFLPASPSWSPVQ
ncbi:MAG: TolB family protein [Actinomycetota bacterium]